MTSSDKPNAKADTHAHNHAHPHSHEHGHDHDHDDHNHGGPHSKDHDHSHDQHSHDHPREQHENVGELRLITPKEEMESVEVKPGMVKRTPGHDPNVMDVREWSYGPGTTFEKHVHGAAQISRILKGRIRVVVGDEEKVLGAGGYYYTPAGVPHQITEVLEPTVELLIGIVSTDTHSHS